MSDSYVSAAHISLLEHKNESKLANLGEKRLTETENLMLSLVHEITTVSPEETVNSRKKIRFRDSNFTDSAQIADDALEFGGGPDGIK